MIYRPRAAYLALSLSFFLPVGFSESPGSSPLLLSTALANTLRYHPSLQASQHRLGASAAQGEQSTATLNPSLEISAEEIDRDNQGMDQASYEVLIAQPIALPGFRKSLRLESETALTQLEREHQVRERQLLHQTIVQYVDAAAAAAEVSVAEDFLELATQTLDAVQKRIDAGKGAPPQLNRVQIAQAQASLALKTAQRHAALTHNRLMSMWGLAPEEFHLPADALSIEAHIRTESNELLETHPEITALDASIQHANAQIQLSKAAVWPELELFAGWQQFEEDDTQSYVLGLQLPLPIWNRNRAEQKATQLEAQALTEDLKAKQLELDAELAEALGAFENALNRVQTLSSKIIPTTENHQRAVSISYKEGRSGLLDFLDANQLVLDMRCEQVDARKVLYLALADLHYLSPLSFPPFQPEEFPHAP
ncbi:TolC family protein [Kiritimatiellota bacterium B12222]|nr:TolC family protein [Kiritimatiellota bacterium B12222]